MRSLSEEQKLTKEQLELQHELMEKTRDYETTILQMNKDLIYARIEVSKEDIDKFKDKMLKWYQKIYKKLFPTRFRINRKVKEYMIRWRIRHFVEKVDQFIAWGDDIRHD